MVTVKCQFPDGVSFDMAFEQVPKINESIEIQGSDWIVASITHLEKPIITLVKHFK